MYPTQVMSDSDSLEFDSGFGSSDSDTELVCENVMDLNLNPQLSLLTQSDVQQRLQNLAQRVAEFTQHPVGVCKIMLNAFDWDLSLLISAFLENKDAVAAKLGLISGADLALLSPSLVEKKMSSITCPICCNESVSLDNCKSMGCRHFVCSDCFDKHTKYHILDERRFFTTKCPGSLECKLIIPQELLNDNQVQRFEQGVTQQYLQAHPSVFRHCPHKNCTYIAYRNSAVDSNTVTSKSCPVQCNCNGKFCFNCGLAFDHLALSCEDAKQWISLVAKDELDSIYLKHNSKKCPKCNSDTERDGGCNHIRCVICHHEYCWVCMDNWTGHELSPFNCVHFKEDTTITSSKSKTSGQKRRARLNDRRLVFYGNRFINHSILSQQVESTHQQKGHNLMSWAFALLFFLETSNTKIMLENLVSALSIDLENNSMHVEQRINALRKFILDTRWVIRHI